MLMEDATFAIRLRVMSWLIAATFLVLVGRLWMLQLTNWTEYAQQAVGNRTEKVFQPAPRGLILDSNGVILAENHPVWNVNIVPCEFPEDQAEAERIITQLAGILGVSTARIREEIGRIKSQTTVQAVPLKEIGEDVSREVVAAIEGRQIEMPGVVIEQQARRHYPRGSLAAHVLGYARAITDEQYPQVKHLTYPRSPRLPQSAPPVTEERIYTPHSIFGQDGVEATYEVYQHASPAVPVLQGRRGYRLYEVDATLNPIGLLAQRDPVPGASVYLTIDVRLQKIAEEALEQTLAGSRRTGAVVMLDTRTGEVLVLASKPSFNPNAWVRGFSEPEWQRLSNDPRTPFLNKAIAGEYPPGSIFKMMSAAAALEAKQLDTSRRFHCAGIIHEGRDHQPFRCWKHKGHGYMNFWQGIAQSCDVYFYELVRSPEVGLDSDTIADYARRFGLGSPTGIDLPGEKEGAVRDRRWKREVRREPWTTGNTLHMVIGQGFLTVTPMQMAVVTAAIANGGKLLRPRVVRKIIWPKWLGWDSQLCNEPQSRKVNVSPDILEKVRRGMRLAVTSANGTAQIMQGLGKPVAGKTGSAEHRPDKPTHAWFTCFAPFDNPRYAVVVFVSEGGSGGVTAAPIARRLLAAAFGIRGTKRAPYPSHIASD